VTAENQRNDPRTWTDWVDPESLGLEKVELDTAFEKVLMAGAYGSSVTALLIILLGRRGRIESLVWPDPAVMPLLATALALAIFFAALRLMTDSFYLIDSSRHLVYTHTRFAFRRRVRLWLERDDIIAVSTETRLIQRSYRFVAVGSYRKQPQQRVVLIGRRGQLVPLGNWKFDALWPCNNRAKELATQLGCPFREAPENCRLVVAMTHGSPVVSFTRFDWWDRLQPPMIYVVGVLAFCALLATIDRLMR
jgi:hypothetical protein